MNEILKLFLSLSVSGSILALVLFVIKPVTKNRMSKRWQYYIWLVVILRFLIPFAPETNVVGSLFNYLENSITASTAVADQGQLPVQTDDNTEIQTALPDTEKPVTQNMSPNYWADIKNSIWLLWIGVAALLFVRKVTSYHSFVRYIKAGTRRIEDERLLEIYKEVSTEAGLKKPLPIFVNQLAVSPMLVGIFRAIIIIPKLELNDSELRNVFLHELTHYKRLDILFKWLTQVAVCLHWFNPLVYLISREINKNCELSCDEAIINGLDEDRRLCYGDTLLSTLKTDGIYSDAIVSVTLSENTSLLKERLGAIMNHKKVTRPIIFISVAFVVLLGVGGILLGAAPPTVNATQPDSVNQAVINLYGKSDAYKLVAQMSEIDTSLSVAEYTNKIDAICETADTNIFSIMSDAEIIEPSDPLYAFATGTLAYTSSELFADAGINPDERSHMSVHALWSRYETDEEIEARRGGMSDEDWNAFLDETANNPPNIAALKNVFYFIFYHIMDKENLTVDERDLMLKMVESDMQNYMEGLREDELFSENFEAAFLTELKKVSAQYSNEKMMLECEISLIEGFTLGHHLQ